MSAFDTAVVEVLRHEGGYVLCAAGELTNGDEPLAVRRRAARTAGL